MRTSMDRRSRKAGAQLAVSSQIKATYGTVIGANSLFPGSFLILNEHETNTYQPVCALVHRPGMPERSKLHPITERQVVFIGDENASCAPAFLKWKGAAHAKASPLQTNPIT